MSKRLSADDLLQEAYAVLAPLHGGSSGEADRRATLREKISTYLAAQRPPTGGGHGGWGVFGAAGGGGIGPTGSATGSNGSSSGMGGGVGALSMDDIWRARAKEHGVPVSGGSGGGDGTKPWTRWFFPDGSSETLHVNEAPVWPKVDAAQLAGRDGE